MIQKKPFPTSFNAKTLTCKIENFHILLIFLLVTMLLRLVVNIYCCLKKQISKQKHLLPYYETSKKLKEIEINNIILKCVVNKLKEIVIKNPTYYFCSDMINT